MSLIWIVLISAIVNADWTVSTSEDKISDTKTILINTKSEHLVLLSKYADLDVSHNCTKKRWNVMLTHPSYVKEGSVEVRFDKNPVRKLKAVTCPDQKCLFFGEADSKTIIEDMNTNQEMVLKYSAPSGKLYLAEFKLLGFKEKHQEATSICNKHSEPN